MDVLPTHKNGGIDKPRGFSFSFLFFFSFFWETVENAQITDMTHKYFLTNGCFYETHQSCKTENSTQSAPKTENPQNKWKRASVFLAEKLQTKTRTDT